MSRRLPAELGEVIGGYRLDELLNRGGMGAVYKATHAVLGRLACVKVLERSLAMDDDYVARFLKEAKIVNDVRHENIVDIFDFVESQNPRRVACIMEYIHGRTLQSVLAQGALTVLQSVNAMLQLIDTLKVVHAKGVIHRDLKPSNIMVVAPLKSDFSVQPAVKILDFGIAKVESSSVGNTGPGTMLGTPAYMAPEQITGDRITAATDVYALGELFFDMVTGHRVFPGTNGQEIITAKLLSHAPSFKLPPSLAEHERVHAMIERCLEPEPSQRPSLMEVEQALLAIGRSCERTAAAEPITRAHSLTHGQLMANTVEIAAPPKQESAMRRLGDYWCFAELPARGMTQAFVARKEGHVEICVLKRLLQHLEGNSTAMARFTREALIAKHLTHPRLAKMFDASIQESTLVIASEFIIGQPLDAVMDRLLDVGQRMPLQVLAPIALGVLDGLAYAHSAKDSAGRSLSIVHRDLTPNAIIIAFSGDVKIRDFGIARASVDDFHTSPGMAVGSIEYMSPEQARSGPLDRRSDIYTVSTVLYEALSGRTAVRPGMTLLDTLKSVTGDRPPPLQQIRPDLSADLIATIERGLEKDPARRWQTAAEYRDALRNGFGRFSSASLDVVGDFLRALMPEEEQRAIDLLGAIREAGELLPSPVRPSQVEPLAHHEPTMSIRQRRQILEAPPEEQEPSVMTMPGAPAPLERPSNVVVSPQPRAHSASPAKRSTSWWMGGLAAVAALALGVAAFMTQVSPTQILVQPDPVQPHPEAIALAPKIAPKEAPPPPVEDEAEEPAHETLEPETLEPETLKPESTVRRVQPRVAHPPPAKSVVAEVPAPPPPPASSSVSVPFAAIRRQVAQLRSNPKDVKLFDSILGSIAQASRDLPADGRRRVKVDLDAAERTYDVELLSAALEKLALETAKAAR